MIEEGCKSNKSLSMFLQSVGAFFKEPRLNKPDFAKPRSTEDAILVIGGWANEEACNYIESFDFRANKWCVSTLKDPLGPRGYLGAAVIGSKLYLVGGTNFQRHFKEGAVLDLANGGKKNIAPMSVVRPYMNLVSIKGYLYAVGGVGQKTIEQYDPAQNQ